MNPVAPSSVRYVVDPAIRGIAGRNTLHAPGYMFVTNGSAEGAKYDSQGQALSEAKCVAPGPP